MARVMLRDGLQKTVLFEALTDARLNVKFISDTSDSCVDIWLGNETVVQFIDIKQACSQKDILESHKARVRQLAKNFPRPIVIIIHRSADIQCFYRLQEVIVIENELTLISVEDPNQAASYIRNLLDCSSSGIGSSCSHLSSSPHPHILQAVQCLPKTGKVKSHNLLENFKSISGIANAKIEDLKAVVGTSSANAIRSFFHDPINV